MIDLEVGACRAAVASFIGERAPLAVTLEDLAPGGTGDAVANALPLELREERGLVEDGRDRPSSENV